MEFCFFSFNRHKEGPYNNWFVWSHKVEKLVRALKFPDSWFFSVFAVAHIGGNVMILEPRAEEVYTHTTV